jgi:hypothetical protein
MTDYGWPLAVDIMTVIACTLLLIRFGDLRFSHPGTPYIIFHLHTVTVRLAGLAGGATTLYGASHGWFEPVMPFEIVRAALFCDIAFWSVTVVWILFKVSPKNPAEPEARTSKTMRIDPKILRPILAFAFIFGVIGLRVAARVPGIPVYEGFDPTSEWTASSYIIILPSWFGLAVLGYIYYYGFGRISSGLLILYLVLMSLQGGMRFRVIIGALLAVQIWVERQNRRWPSRAMVAGLGLAALAFFPMKTVGHMIISGDPWAEIQETFSDSVTDVSEGAADDQMFLDEFASSLTLLDLQGKYYWGSMYVPLLTLPIPRALWPEKPVLAGFLTDISSRSRPMATSGMIVTYLGEAYANFGTAGVFLVPPLLALFLAYFCRRAYAAPRDSVLRFTYVLLSVNLIQVYRDGLVSLFVFTFVNMMPLMAIVVVHFLASLGRLRRGGQQPAALPS